MGGRTLSQQQKAGRFYTSDEVIDKVLAPLFMDELFSKAESISEPGDLRKFRARLAAIKFLEPACGRGGFFRRIMEALRDLQDYVDDEIGAGGPRVGNHQLYGIELDPDAAADARVSYPGANITTGDALELAWSEILPSDGEVYVCGNPPFLGQDLQSDYQRGQTKRICHAGNLDYVCNWFVKAASYAGSSSNVRIAFVTTNSITSGEHVPPLWPRVFQYGLEISFAYTAFDWESDDMAGVFVAIIGLGKGVPVKRLFTGDEEKNPKCIDPYLRESDGDYMIVQKALKPINGLLRAYEGTKFADDGNYIFDETGRAEFVKVEPEAGQYMVRYYTGDIVTGNKTRFALATHIIPKHRLDSMPHVIDRMAEVLAYRNSQGEYTRRTFTNPTRFMHERIYEKPTLLIPRTASGNRRYIPMAFAVVPCMCTAAVAGIVGATVELFGLLESRMYMAWSKAFGGLMKNDYRHSITMSYNTFPAPADYSTLEPYAQAVLDQRKKHWRLTLGDMYSTMPPPLEKVHDRLDQAVDRLYRAKPFRDDEDRLEHLMARYRKMIPNQRSLLEWQIATK